MGVRRRTAELSFGVASHRERDEQVEALAGDGEEAGFESDSPPGPCQERSLSRIQMAEACEGILARCRLLRQRNREMLDGICR
jgi:hypothetical protein